MTKAFELQGLVDELKKQGLELLEEEVKVAAKAVFNWVEESVKLTENKYDDFFLLARPRLESVLGPAIEKINPAD